MFCLELMPSKPPLICVPICERNLSELERKIKAVGLVADLIEIRLDCIDQHGVRPVFGDLDELCAGSQKPTIVTYRPAEQGGNRELDLGHRAAFWIFNRPRRSQYFDIEADVVDDGHLFNSALPPPDWTRVICSYHDFVGMPSNLDRVYEQLAKTPARILKIAVQVEDVADCIPLFRLLDRALDEGRQMIPIAMGQAGIATRILGPSRGAFLTYATMDDTRSTAPGQLTVQELRETYRVDAIDRNTEIFGVVGRPISHSISPEIHNAAFKETAYNGVYLPLEVRDVHAFMRRMVHPQTRELDWNMRGLSVTTPHKVAAMDQLDWIEPQAKEIGAVNTIVVNAGGVHGYNTDAGGFLDGLRIKLDVVEGRRCAVIGTGGAARAAVWALRKAAADVTVVSRDRTRAESVAANFEAAAGTLASISFEGFDLVVNATSLGNAGEFQDQTPASSAQLRGARFAYDLVYNPIETRFLREAREAGCETISGLEMFIAQAVRQFEMWTGKAAPRDVITAAANRALQNRER